MAAQTVIDLELSPSLTNLLEVDVTLETKRGDNGTTRNLFSPSPSILFDTEQLDSDRESHENHSNRDDIYDSRVTTMNNDHIHCSNMESFENLHTSDNSRNNTIRHDRTRRKRQGQGNSFVMINHARAHGSLKSNYRRHNIRGQRDGLHDPVGNGRGGSSDLADRGWGPADSNSRNHQWPNFGPEIPGSGPIGSIPGFPSLVERPGIIPWMDPFGFEAMNLYTVVQQVTEEKQGLRARIAELEQHLERSRRVSALYHDKFQALRDEAGQALREWSREVVRTRQEQEWSD